MSQKIICTTAIHLAQAGDFEGLQFDLDPYRLLIENSDNQILVPREGAETQPAILQLIPYCILWRKGRSGAREVLVYQRTKQSDEGRLRGNFSMGFGGHLEGFGFPDEVERELSEELGIHLDECEEALRIRALLRDTSNPVGRVHLGLIVPIRVGYDLSGEIESKEDKIELHGWFSTDTLAEAPLDGEWESWSKICLAQIEKLLDNDAGILL